MSFNDNYCFSQFMIGTVTVCSYIHVGLAYFTSVNQVYVLKTHGYHCPPKPKSKHLISTVPIELEGFKCLCIN